VSQDSHPYLIVISYYAYFLQLGQPATKLRPEVLILQYFIAQFYSVHNFAVVASLFINGRTEVHNIDCTL